MTLVRQPGSAWQRAYYLDFTQQANLTVASGSNTIDGKTWTGTNTTSAATFAIQQGTGLVVAANSSNTDYFNANRTTPLLRTPISTLFPGYSIERHIVRVMCRVILTNADTNFEFAKVGIENNGSPTSLNFTTARGSSGGSIVTECHGTLASTTTIYTGTGLSSGTAPGDDIMGVVFDAPTGVEWRSGLFANNQFPQSFRFRASTIFAQSTPIMLLPSDPCVVLVHQTDNSTAAFTATFTHLAIDYIDKFPAG